MLALGLGLTLPPETQLSITAPTLNICATYLMCVTWPCGKEEESLPLLLICGSFLKLSFMSLSPEKGGKGR